MTERFAALHADDTTFVLPNPWDVGSARLLESLGFPALATTSSGFAAALGKPDMHLTRDQLLGHVEDLATAVDVPLNVDAERCFSDSPAGVAQTIGLIADAGAAGCSIEDYDPATDAIDPIEVAVERCAVAADAAHQPGRELVLTARAENLLHAVTDLDETIARLTAFRDVGADVVYAPGLTDLADIRRVIEEVDIPVNVLLLPSGPSIATLADAGVRRVSTGGALAFAAYGAMVAHARGLLEGTTSYWVDQLSRTDRSAAFGD